MTEADARYAVELLDARRDFADVRKGLALEGGCVVLKLTAFEGDRDGGSHHGSALVPLRLAQQIVAFAEDLIRAEMKRLGITETAKSVRRK